MIKITFFSAPFRQFGSCFGFFDIAGWTQYTYIAGKYQIHLHLLWNRTKLYIFIYVYKYDCTIHIKVQNCVFYKFLHHYSMINDRLIIDVDPGSCQEFNLRFNLILYFYRNKRMIVFYCRDRNVQAI